MEFFNKHRAVKLRSRHGTYLVADDNQDKVRQSRNGASRRARWLVELVETNGHVIRLKSCHGRYLAASDEPFLLGITGNRVSQTVAGAGDGNGDLSIEWQPIRDGFEVKLRGFKGTYLRANGGTPPWRNSVTHDLSQSAPSRHRWVLWDVEGVDLPETDSLTNYFSMLSTFSALSDEVLGTDLGSPALLRSISSPRWSTNNKSPIEVFRNAKVVRLRSHHEKYLHAEEDEISVAQHQNGPRKNSRWTVELVDGGIFQSNKTVLRLKSCYGKYLTASIIPCLLRMTGRKVLQTLPERLDSSVEWEPIRVGNRIKLRTCYGQFLRANGGLPPWRNSVTHDIPYRSVTRDWILWEVDIVEFAAPKSSPPQLVLDSRPSGFKSNSPFTDSDKSTCYTTEESGSSLNSTPKAGDVTVDYYPVADESSSPFNKSTISLKKQLGSSLNSTPKAGDGTMDYHPVADEPSSPFNKSTISSKKQSGSSLNSTPKAGDGTMEYYPVADESSSPLNKSTISPKKQPRNSLNSLLKTDDGTLGSMAYYQVAVESPSPLNKSTSVSKEKLCDSLNSPPKAEEERMVYYQVTDEPLFHLEKSRSSPRVKWSDSLNLPPKEDDEGMLIYHVPNETSPYQNKYTYSLREKTSDFLNSPPKEDGGRMLIYNVPIETSPYLNKSTYSLREKTGDFLNSPPKEDDGRMFIYHVPNEASPYKNKSTYSTSDFLNSPPKEDDGRMINYNVEDAHSVHWDKTRSSSIEEMGDCLNSPPKADDGRMIYYHVVNEFGDDDEDVEEFCIIYKGNDVEGLTSRLEEETGLEDISVCTRSPLNRKLCPIHLQLPPNNVALSVVVVPSSAKAARTWYKRAGISYRTRFW